MNEIKKTDKYKEWLEDYRDIVPWEVFRDNYVKCDHCGHYDVGPCICYAR